MPDYFRQPSSPVVRQPFSARKFAGVLWEGLNDGWLNITTMSASFSTHLIDPGVHFRASENAVQTTHADAVGYQNPDHLELRRIITLQPCGAGRSLRFGVR